MATALPIALQGEQVSTLLGTCFHVDNWENRGVFITATHLLSNYDTGMKLAASLPNHMGDLSRVQYYPRGKTPLVYLHTVYLDPLTDISVLVSLDTFLGPLPKFQVNREVIEVGSSVKVFGYPFAPLGSVLETCTNSYISGKGLRLLAPDLLEGGVAEWVLGCQSHPGQSGSPVISSENGTILGMVRGSLAPPGLVKISGLSVGTDSSVTYAVDSSHIIEVLTTAKGVFKLERQIQQLQSR